MDHQPGNCRLIGPSFPSELLLKTIEMLPFENGKLTRTLSLTHPVFADLLRKYERSVTESILRTELPHAIYDFPCPAEDRGYAWIKTIDQQYDTIDDIMTRLLDGGNCKSLAPHNMAMVYTGFLLLYRLSSIDSPKARLAFLTSLPLDPLTALYTSITHSLHAATYHSPASLLHWSTYGRVLDWSSHSMRADMHAAFCEASLQLGPSFIRASLYEPASVEPQLLNTYHETTLHMWDAEDVGALVSSLGVKVVPPITVGPKREEGDGVGCVEWVTLKGRVAALMKVEEGGICEALEREMEWPGHRLAGVGPVERERLVRGWDV